MSYRNISKLFQATIRDYQEDTSQHLPLISLVLISKARYDLWITKLGVTSVIRAANRKKESDSDQTGSNLNRLRISPIIRNLVAAEI